jgi:hypothetical protein
MIILANPNFFPNFALKIIGQKPRDSSLSFNKSRQTASSVQLRSRPGSIHREEIHGFSLLTFLLHVLPNLGIPELNGALTNNVLLVKIEGPGAGIPSRIICLLLKGFVQTPLLIKQPMGKIIYKTRISPLSGRLRSAFRASVDKVAPRVVQKRHEIQSF